MKYRLKKIAEKLGSKDGSCVIFTNLNNAGIPTRTVINGQAALEGKTLKEIEEVARSRGATLIIDDIPNPYES